VAGYWCGGVYRFLWVLAAAENFSSCCGKGKGDVVCGQKISNYWWVILCCRPEDLFSAVQQRALKPLTSKGGYSYVMKHLRWWTRASQDWMTKKQQGGKPRFFFDSCRSGIRRWCGISRPPRDPSGHPASHDAESETAHSPALGSCRASTNLIK
jgi:hypothetical protein